MTEISLEQVRKIVNENDIITARIATVIEDLIDQAKTDQSKLGGPIDIEWAAGTVLGGDSNNEMSTMIATSVFVAIAEELV